jgi:catechol 2,3-dioxygenase-like lactoylglutathione lyase family enzyme
MKGTPTKYNHTALSVRDLEESIEWYGEFFGLKELSRMTIPHNGFKLAFIGNENFTLELFCVPGANPLPEGRSHPDTDNCTLGVKHMCFAVDNNREFIQNLKERGVKIAFEPPNMPSYAAFINDPTGNIIEIFDTSFDVASIRQ